MSSRTRARGLNSSGSTGSCADDLPPEVRPRELRVVSDDTYADWRGVLRTTSTASTG